MQGLCPGCRISLNNYVAKSEHIWCSSHWKGKNSEDLLNAVPGQIEIPVCHVILLEGMFYQ